MSPIAIVATAFALILVSTLVGAVLRPKMPERHLTGDSKEVIRLATALVATLTGLVLALMFASTRASFEITSGAITKLAVSLGELDEVLEEYGPEALSVRRQLRADVGPLVDSIWQDDAKAAGRAGRVRRVHTLGLQPLVRELQPKTSVQTALQVHALQLAHDISQTRLALVTQPPDSVSTPFVVVIVLWLMFIFSTFAMSARLNATLATILFLCILSASGAIYLILELGLPFGGLMQVSSDGLRAALTPL